jgi:LysM repeat protein
LCLAAITAALAVACGEDASSADPPDLSRVPTATLPAELPEAIVVGGGAVQPGGQATYTVRAGDSLAGISERFGFTIEELIAANPGIEDRGLQAGDVINLPLAPGDVPTPAPATATPEPPEAAPTDAPPEPSATPQPPAETTPSATGQTYVVKSGDIPVTIAEQFGITVEALIAANPGIDARNLQVGQTLIIPPAPN